MNWIGAMWAIFLLMLVVFVVCSHTELQCQNNNAEPTFSGRGFIVGRSSDWVSVDGETRRLLPGESCLQTRKVGL